MENSIAYFACCLMIILLLIMNACNSSDRSASEGLLLELPNGDKLDTAIDNVWPAPIICTSPYESANSFGLFGQMGHFGQQIPRFYPVLGRLGILGTNWTNIMKFRSQVLYPLIYGCLLPIILEKFVTPQER